MVAALAACASSTPLTTFTLSAPEEKVRGANRLPGLILVAEPTAIQVLASDRIVVKDAVGTVSYLPGAQWADQLPNLVQSRIIFTFENASRIATVSRPGDRVTPDYQLNTEIRAFQIETATNEAVVQLAVKAVRDTTGRIAAGRIFTARVPVAAVEPVASVRALDEALSQVLLDIVRWAGAGASPAAT